MRGPETHGPAGRGARQASAGARRAERRSRSDDRPPGRARHLRQSARRRASPPGRRRRICGWCRRRWRPGRRRRWRWTPPPGWVTAWWSAAWSWPVRCCCGRSRCAPTGRAHVRRRGGRGSPSPPCCSVSRRRPPRRGLHGADLRRGPVPELARQYAQVTAEVEVTSDPRLTRPADQGQPRGPDRRPAQRRGPAGREAGRDGGGNANAGAADRATRVAAGAGPAARAGARPGCRCCRPRGCG